MTGKTRKRKPLTPREKELRRRGRSNGRASSRRSNAAPGPRRSNAQPGRAARQAPAPAERGGLFAYHPLADAFPLIEGEEFTRFCARMKARGFRSDRPIVLHDDMILDGRNRYRAAVAAGVTPISRLFDPETEGDPLEFVISENLDRRHLNASQRAMCAARLETFRHGGARTGEAGADRKSVSKLLNVSARTVADAAFVRDAGSDKLQAAVGAGSVPVSVAASVAALPAAEQDQLIASGEKEILAAAKKIRAVKSEARRSERVERLRVLAKGNSELKTDKRYPVILADPNWRYEFPAMGDTEKSIENHYDTWPLKKICALPVRKLATKDAVLFLWITVPLTYHAVPRVLKAWGFEFKSEIVWDKETIGTGKWTRNQHEKLLICTRGKMPLPPPSAVPASVLRVRKGEHSAKPGAINAIIEAMYPTLPRIELFAAQTRLGWDSWGNQIQGGKAVSRSKRRAKK